MSTFARLVFLEGRSDGLRALHVPQELAPLLEAWVLSKEKIDPVDFLRDHLRKQRLPPPRPSA